LSKANSRDDYPAGEIDSGRRAREVMPAAMRALVRTGALAQLSFIGRASCQRFAHGATIIPPA
jgi:hypothetical protein